MNLDLREIQGLLASGYGGSVAARYLLAEVVEPFPAGRALLQLANLVTFADAVTRKEDTKIGTQVNVAFSAAGLTELGITPDAMADFSREFREGMVTTHRQRILGDLEGSPSDPVGWRWGGPSNPQVHVALLLFARDDQLLTTLTAGVTALLAGMRIVRTLETVRLADNREHFGFRDGISSPWVEGLHPPQSAPDRIAAGEIVLGLPDFSGVPEPYPPLGRNGSYLVMRQLAQDVEGFWAGLRGTVGDASAVRWATKMTGRWPDGTPLAKSPDGPTADPTNDFGYRSDLDGLRCPVGAHIRRTNPRDSLTGDSTRSAELVSRHRLLRRGRSFGLPAAPDSWPAGIDPVMTQSHRADDSGARGIVFACLGASLARQFEFVQQSWLENPKFGGLFDENDPITGGPQRRVTPGAVGFEFTAPGPDLNHRIELPDKYVSCIGGEYFFVPGRTALLEICAAPSGGARTR